MSARGIEGPPTLVVEVLSPSTAQVDRSTKLQLYARYGIPYYWIVELEGQRIDAYALAEGAFKLAARLDRGESGALPPFPDLTIVATSLWR